MKPRANQKNRRNPRKIQGAYVHGQTERYCVLHPTKGFRERNIISIMAEHQSGRDNYNVRALNKAMMRVQTGQQPTAVSNKPTTLHRRSGG